MSSPQGAEPSSCGGTSSARSTAASRASRRVRPNAGARGARPDAKCTGRRGARAVRADPRGPPRGRPGTTRPAAHRPATRCRSHRRGRWRQPLRASGSRFARGAPRADRSHHEPPDVGQLAREPAGRVPSEHEVVQEDERGGGEGERMRGSGTDRIGHGHGGCARPKVAGATDALSSYMLSSTAPSTPNPTPRNMLSTTRPMTITTLNTLRPIPI